MKNMDEFEYTYSAKRQAEIDRIRKKYLPEEDAYVQLKKLDAMCEQKATTYAIIVGLVGTLIFGYGMTCVLVWAETLFVVGIVMGMIGLLLIALALPIYTHYVKKERTKIAPKIQELLQQLDQ